jgi:hypothetical protein
VCISSNSYLTFGAGSTIYSNLGPATPSLPTIFIGAFDTSYFDVGEFFIIM